ncbi:biotin transporter BioY [Megamonas hypermegale]|uniref:biotin transporter BioY n=1 Tax=Megamonas hypermegale TaxID=158847 RepID=UPI0025A36783|nr:biotin transporter BioY [Megamonas hypermegale]MDM8143880.1 biotin transporter BioY [Megamonas hypermegale]
MYAEKKLLNVKNMILCALFVALIAIGAFIKIPVPVCPFTLQLLFTTLAGLLLGARLGFTAVIVYVAVGLIGIPVFTQGGGPSYVLQPTFGYLIGFAVGSYIVGILTEKIAGPSLVRLLTANFINLLIVYLFGMIYVYAINEFYLNTPIGIWPLFLYCFVLAVPGDIVLCIVAAVLGRKLIPVVRK